MLQLYLQLLETEEEQRDFSLLYLSEADALGGKRYFTRR